MLNPAHALATLQKNVIVSCDQLGETFRAAPTLLRRGPAFSEDIPTLSTQPRANSMPSDHVTPLHARSQAPRDHSLGSDCTRTNDPYLHKKRFSFSQKTRSPLCTLLTSVQFSRTFYSQMQTASRFDFRATFAMGSIVRSTFLFKTVEMKDHKCRHRSVENQTGQSKEKKKRQFGGFH